MSSYWDGALFRWWSSNFTARACFLSAAEAGYPAQAGVLFMGYCCSASGVAEVLLLVYCPTSRGVLAGCWSCRSPTTGTPAIRLLLPIEYPDWTTRLLVLDDKQPQGCYA